MIRLEFSLVVDNLSSAAEEWAPLQPSYPVCLVASRLLRSYPHFHSLFLFQPYIFIRSKTLYCPKLSFFSVSLSLYGNTTTIGSILHFVKSVASSNEVELFDAYSETKSFQFQSYTTVDRSRFEPQIGRYVCLVDIVKRPLVLPHRRQSSLSYHGWRSTTPRKGQFRLPSDSPQLSSGQRSQ